MQFSIRFGPEEVIPASHPCDPLTMSILLGISLAKMAAKYIFLFQYRQN